MCVALSFSNSTPTVLSIATAPFVSLRLHCMDRYTLFIDNISVIALVAGVGMAVEVLVWYA